MRKALILLLTLALVFTLTACGGGNSNSGSGDNDPLTRPGGTTSGTDGASATPETSAPSGAIMPDVDFDAIMAGGGGDYAHLSPAEKQAIIDAGKENGIDVTFEADGSAKFVDTEEGTVAIQKPDGTWTIETDDGIQGQIGGDWPDNEFTRLVPKPEFSVSIAGSDEESFNVTFTDATIEQIREYAEKVEAAGFTVDAETQDMEVMGMVVFTYTAKNADGYALTVFSAQGTTGLSIEKP